MTDTNAPNRFLTLWLSRSQSKVDDTSAALLLKALRTGDEPEVKIPAITPVKAPAITWTPPKVAVAEDLPTDAAERFLAEQAAAKAKAARIRK